MVNLKLNGQDKQAPAGMTVLQSLNIKSLP